MFSQYEKISLIGLIKEQLYQQFNIYKKSKIPQNLIMPVNSQSFSFNLGVYISLYKDDKLRSCSGTIETNNVDFTILTNIKKIINELAITKSNYKDLHFLPIDPSELNKLTFNINILYHLIPISINEYFGSTFIIGKDGLILKNTDSKKYTYSLTNINIDKNIDSNDTNKKELLESLCKKEFSNVDSNKKCQDINNIKLYYNECLLFSDVDF